MVINTRTEAGIRNARTSEEADFEDVKGQEHAKPGIEVAGMAGDFAGFGRSRSGA